LLSYVDAADSIAAELAAIRAFDLSEEDRKRLIVRERVYFLAMPSSSEREPAAFLESTDCESERSVRDDCPGLAS
jgi:hypothetical protein